MMSILACHKIRRAALNMRGACESYRMIKLTERVNDDPIRKNDAAIKELVAKKMMWQLKDWYRWETRYPPGRSSRRRRKDYLIRLGRALVLMKRRRD